MSRNNGIIKFWLGARVITVVELKYLEAESWESSVEWTFGRESRSINISVYEKKVDTLAEGIVQNECVLLVHVWAHFDRFLTYKHVA